MVLPQHFRCEHSDRRLHAIGNVSGRRRVVGTVLRMQVVVQRIRIPLLGHFEASIVAVSKAMLHACTQTGDELQAVA